MEKFFHDKNLGCHVIAGSPRNLGSTSPKPEVLESGSTRKCEIWPLLSDRDPNPRPNDGNCFREELSVRTSANIKLVTGRTRRIPRVRFHLWRNLSSSENFYMERFLDRQDPSLTVRQREHLRMMMGNSRGKFELSRWRIIATDLGNSSVWLGNSKLGISSTGNSADVISANTHAKGLYPCMAMHGQIRNFYLCAKFLFVDRFTCNLVTWRGSTLGVTHKFFRRIPPGEQKLRISKFPNCKPMGKWPLESDVLTLRCHEELWKIL